MIRSRRLFQGGAIIAGAMIVCMAFMVMPSKTAYAVEKPEIFVQTGHSSSADSIAFSPDGRYVLSGSGDKTLKLWEVATGREIRLLKGIQRG